MPGPQRDLAAERVVNLLRGAVVNLRTFMADSLVTTESLQNAHGALSEHLQKKSPLILSHRDEQLWVDLKHIVAVKGFRELMSARKVRNLTFTRGITLTETKALVEGLSKRKEELANFKDFKSWLDSHKVVHIEPDDMIQLDPEEEKIWLERKQALLTPTGPGSPDLSVVIHQTLNWLQKTSDPLVQERVRQELIENLLEVSPEQLHTLFLSPDAQAGPAAELLDQFTGSLSRDKIEEIIKYACRWQVQIKVAVRPSAEPALQIDGLKNFLKKILRAPASQDISPT